MVGELKRNDRRKQAVLTADLAQETGLYVCWGIWKPYETLRGTGFSQSFASEEKSDAAARISGDIHSNMPRGQVSSKRNSTATTEAHWSSREKDAREY